MDTFTCLGRFSEVSVAPRLRQGNSVEFSASVVAAILVSLITPVAKAQATAYPGVPPLLLGAAWYPEQWPESQGDADLDKMEAANIHLVRVGRELSK